MQAAQTRSADESSYRLPKSVIPSRYTLTLAPDLKNFTFNGEVDIAISVKVPVNTVLLNAAELEIQSATLGGQNGSVSLQPEDERASIAFNETIAPGEYILALRFTGILNDKLHGFYRSTFKDQDGVEHVIATTQFESTDARRAFPCFDEPEFKAVFQTTLIVPEHLMPISNGKELSSTPIGDGTKRVVFAETMPMSTYLVAFIVGPFEATDPVIIGDNIPLRVITPRGKLHLANFALGIGKFSTEYFAKWTGIPYPSDKLDLIAVPDFAFGAMENLACVTFRETALLADEKTASRGELERIADVVAHEIGHMWFGDLVTMAWWNGVWLKEAFATFMEVKAVDAWKPEWKRWDSFSLSRSAAMGVDSLKNTRTVEFPVRRPEEATGMYDLLTYEKGCSLVRMIEQFIGEDAFQVGINHYLTKHLHGNADTSDLWDGLQTGTDQPVRAIMDSWIYQAGFPMVSVEPSENGVSITQSMFRYLGDGESTLWQTPVILRSGKKTSNVLLSTHRTEIAVEDKDGPIVVNAGSHGFYRVRYAPELLAKLRKSLDKLSAIERYTLIDDTWASVVAGLTSIADFVDLAEWYRDDDDDNVWTRIAGAFAYLKRASDESLHPGLEARLRALVAPKAKTLGWEPEIGETELRGQLRATLIGALGVIGNDKETQAEAKKRLDSYIATESGLDRNLVGAAVSIVAYAGDENQYVAFLDRYKNAKTPQEELRYLMALTNFRDVNLVKRTLDMTLGDDVRSQNAAFVLGSSLGNPVAHRVAWDFIRANWQTFVGRLPANNIPRIVSGLSSIFDAGIADEAVQFFEENPPREGGRLIKQELERQQIALQFKEREAAAIRALAEG